MSLNQNIVDIEKPGVTCWTFVVDEFSGLFLHNKSSPLNIQDLHK